MNFWPIKEKRYQDKHAAWRRYHPKKASRWNLTSKVVMWAVGIICVAVALLFCGCASLSVNPETGEVVYRRLGNQNLTGVRVETPAGYKIYFDQDSKTEALKTALGIAEALK